MYMDLRGREKHFVSARQGVTVLKNALTRFINEGGVCHESLWKIFGEELKGTNIRKPKNKYVGVLESFSVQARNVFGRGGNIKDDFKLVARAIFLLERAAHDNDLSVLSGGGRVVVSSDEEISKDFCVLSSRFSECSEGEYQSVMSVRGGDTLGVLQLIAAPR